MGGNQTAEQTLIQNVSKCDESDPEADTTLSQSVSRQERLLQQKRSIAPWDNAPTLDQTSGWTDEQTYEYYVELYKYCEVRMTVRCIQNTSVLLVI